MRQNNRIATHVIVTKFDCPHCGATMLRDDENCSTMHVLPVCSQWLRHCESTGVMPDGIKRVSLARETKGVN